MFVDSLTGPAAISQWDYHVYPSVFECVLL